ncbi:MAG: hypothetical protein WCX81_05915 [Monoglobales bacterium]
MTKKIIAIFLVILINLSAFSFAAENFTLGNFFYTIETESDSIDGSNHIILKAVGVVDNTIGASPPDAISAKDIYDALNFPSDDTSPSKAYFLLLRK